MIQRLIITIVIKTLFLIASSLVHAADNIQNTPPSTLEWITSPEGVGFAALTGDRFIEPYIAMVKLPGGLVSPAHTKTANMFGVVIAGTMVHSTVDTNPQNDVILAKGSFYKIPKNVPHISKCVFKIMRGMHRKSR